MKTPGRRLLPVALVSASLLAAACSKSADKPAPEPAPTGEKPPVEAAELAEVEPNNAREGAQLLAALPVTVRGEIAGPDIDVFAFEVAESGGHLLHARVDQPGVSIRLLKADGSAVVEVVSPERIAAARIVKGRWYVAVAGTGEGQGRGAYALELTRSRWARGVEIEPNDRLKQASKMRTERPPTVVPDEDKEESLGAEFAHYSVVGWWSTRGDVDCFRVPPKRVSSTSVLRIELVPPAGVRARVTLSSEGSEVAAAESGAADKPAVVPAMAVGLLDNPVVLCGSAAEGVNFEQPYRVDVWVLEPRERFELEPNDTVAAATTLEREHAVEGYLTAGDVDWWQIPGFHKPEVVIKVSAPPGVGVEAVLVHRDSTEPGSRVEVEPGQRAELRGATPAQLIVRATTGASTAKPYRLLVEIAEPPGSAEAADGGEAPGNAEQ